MFVLFLGVALVAAVLDETAMRTLAGTPGVVDGDTLVFEGRRVRLAGIDAPELGQSCRRGDGDYTCGREARAHLAGLLGAGIAECRGNQEDRYGRLLVRCDSAGIEVNAAMVRAGWAVSYGAYEREERLARNDRAGLWAGSFERPSDWRAMHGAVTDIGPASVARRLIDRLADMVGMNTGEEKK